MTIAELVSAFGGKMRLATALGLTHSHVDYWLRVGYVPLKKHNAVLKAAEARNLAITREILLAQIQLIAPRPLGGYPSARVKAPEVLALTAAGVKSELIASQLHISYSSVRRIIRGRS